MKESTIIKNITQSAQKLYRAQGKGTEADIDVVANFIAANYPITAICHTLAEYILNEEQIEPIAITEEEFYKHFRILGTKRVNGEIIKENRGRKVGTKIVDGKVVTPKQ